LFGNVNMRLALIALTVGCFSFGFTTQANETIQQTKTVENLELDLSTKQTEYDAFVVALNGINEQVSNEKTRLLNRRSQGKQLQQLREQALLNMNEQYEALVDNPEQDIADAQNAYRQAILNQKENKRNIKASIHNLTEAKAELAQANIDRFTLANTLETLNEEINIARVKRLRNEFEKQDELQVKQTVTCDPQSTFTKCITRGNLLAKQKASKTFLDKLFLSATESSLITQNKTDSGSRVRLLKHKVISGGFSGQGVYGTTITVKMQGSLPENEACALLNISERYCIYQATDLLIDTSNNANEAVKLNDESVMYELTVRSDQYDDEVFIDGVSYGSTRLSVMLSSGIHSVIINKPGYKDYEQEIRLNKNTVIKAELTKALLNLANGEKIQDILHGDQLGPELIGVPAGNFQVGDLKGAGLRNEKPAHSEQILTAFAIGQNQITVGDFKHFINETKYVTEAESEEGCAAFTDGTPQYDSVLNWRNPGFKQSDDHPVVCVSGKDSQAYLKWLSKTTARNYRLPNEKEWEYVARAGSADNFWWGNDIGSGKANCAYCGSKWSNQSTAPVKSFRANAFGLFDTVGNVWEITQGNDIVARGGAWNFTPKLARTSVRLELSESFRSNYIGFRALREN